MKKLILLFCVACLATQSFGQLSVGNFTINSVGITTAIDRDMMKTMDANYFLSMTKEEVSPYLQDLNFDHESMYSMLCENPNIRLDATVTTPKFANTEFRVAINAIFNRIDAVSYYTSNNESYSHLNLTSYGSEVAAEVVAIKTLSLGNRVKLYGGLGTNVGFAFGNNLYVYGSSETFADQPRYNNRSEIVSTVTSPTYSHFDEYYKLNNGVSQRVFAQGAVGVRVWKGLEITAESRLGIGYRYITGHNPKKAQLVSGALGLRYNLDW